MKNKTKYLLIGTVLLTAAAGSVIAFGGLGNCNQGDGPMFGKGQFGQMQNQQRMAYMQGLRQLDNLTDNQREQLRSLRQSQRELMSEKRNDMAALQAEMKGKVDAILTAEQRETLDNMVTSNFGRHGRRGHFGG